MGVLTKDSRPQFAGLRGKLPQEVFGSLPTPCYILDEVMLKHNGEILAGVAERTGCKILLAQKAFSNYDLYPVLASYLAGTEASGLYEARLGAEEMPGKEVHVFCAAYREDEFAELLKYAGHIVFNSPRQLAKYGAAVKQAGKSVGLRINPECSTQEGHAIYDPCAPGSRMGTTRAQWDEQMTPELAVMLDGLHFHTLCEQDAGDLEITLQAVEQRFGDVLPKMQWLNFGGGHHITRPGYNISLLERCINYAQQKWGVTVYLEPGEACALNAGYLATRVPTVRRCTAQATPQKKVIPAVWAAKPALREMLSAITALTRRLAKAICFCLAIWQFTLPAKTIPLTACRCLPFIHIRHQGSLS